MKRKFMPASEAKSENVILRQIVEDLSDKSADELIEALVDYIMAADELTADCAAEFMEQHDYDITSEEDCEMFYEDCHCFVEEITKAEYEKETA